MFYLFLALLFTFYSSQEITIPLLKYLSNMNLSYSHSLDSTQSIPMQRLVEMGSKIGLVIGIAHFIKKYSWQTLGVTLTNYHLFLLLKLHLFLRVVQVLKEFMDMLEQHKTKVSALINIYFIRVNPELFIFICVNLLIFVNFPHWVSYCFISWFINLSKLV
jgi:hypothetical protein